MKQNKIGVFGGTFNPIHNGHLILAQNALEFCDLSQIYFIPSGCSYLKDQSLILPKMDRINMVKLAIEDNPKFTLSTIETDKEGNSYTFETLSDLSRLHPDAELYFIIGDDTLFSIETWKEPQIIFSLCTLIVAPRNNTEKAINEKQIQYLKEKYNAKIVLMDSNNIEISSSNIRNMISNGRSARYYIPDKVRNYIFDKGLYLKK